MNGAPRQFAFLTVIVTTGALLSACSPPLHFGVLLNPDDTIDFVLCDGFRSDGDVAVDYVVGDDDDGPEWVMTSSIPSQAAHRVIAYGEPPSFFETVHLETPPEGWTSVSFGWGWADRSDLTVGEWRWETSELPWVPDQPCISDYSLGVTS